MIVQSHIECTAWQRERLVKMSKGICLVLLAVTLATNCVNAEIERPEERTKYAGCHERWLAGETKPGVYRTYPNTTHPVQQAASVVIQRRVDHTVSFYRGWQDYKRGFGSPQGSYWAGLDMIHYLTNTGYTTLRIDMSDWSGNNRYIIFNHFSVQDESRFYQMTVSPASQGNVNDDIGFSNGMRFATFDYYDPNQCAIHQKAGWWYNYCSYALPNGIYYHGGPYSPSGSFYDGIFWKDWLGYGYSLRFISMTLFKY